MNLINKRRNPCLQTNSVINGLLRVRESEYKLSHFDTCLPVPMLPWVTNALRPVNQISASSLSLHICPYTGTKVKYQDYQAYITAHYLKVFRLTFHNQINERHKNEIILLNWFTHFISITIFPNAERKHTKSKDLSLQIRENDCCSFSGLGCRWNVA